MQFHVSDSFPPGFFPRPVEPPATCTLETEYAQDRVKIVDGHCALQIWSLRTLVQQPQWQRDLGCKLAGRDPIRHTEHTCFHRLDTFLTINDDRLLRHHNLPRASLGPSNLAAESDGPGEDHSSTPAVTSCPSNLAADRDRPVEGL